MSRDITAAMQAAIVAPSLKFLYLVEIEFASEIVRLTSNPRDVSWNAQTWLGNGMLRRPSSVRESTDIRANGFSISLGGIDPAMLSLVLSDLHQNQYGIIYFALLDASEAVIVDPLIIAKGKFDTTEIQENAAGPEITIYYESDLIRRDRTNEFRLTHESQQAIFPGDNGFKYVDTIEDWSGFWGKGPKPKASHKKRKVKHK